MALPPRPLAVIVPGRPGLPIRLEAPAFHDRQVTNADGYTLFAAVPDHDVLGPQANLFVDDPASDFWGKVIDVPTGAHQFFIGPPVPSDPPGHPGFNVLLPPLVPLTPPLPVFRPLGRDLVDAQGARTLINGCDGFLDLRLFKDHGEGALLPFFQESRSIGFNVRRIFCQGAISQNQVMQLDPREPGFYEAVDGLIDAENRHGFVALLEIGIDNQVLGLGYDHWDRIGGICRNHPGGAIYSGGNEVSKNGFDRSKVPDPGLPLWTRGSEQSNGLPDPHAPLLLFHPVRDFPTALRDAAASPVQIFDVLHFLPAPLLIDEPPRMGTNGSGPAYLDPATCGRFAGIYAVMGAGAVFHTYFGQRGQLLDPLTRACAMAWSAQMRP